MWMTDIRTCLRCNHLIVFRQALIRCVHYGFVAWYRADSATGTISYKQTPPNTQVRMFQTTVFHIRNSQTTRRAVNDLTSDLEPSCIMSDFTDETNDDNVNVHTFSITTSTSSIIQHSKNPSHSDFDNTTASLTIRCEHSDTTICSHITISSRNKNEPCANRPFPAFLSAPQEPHIRPAKWRAGKK